MSVTITERAQRIHRAFEQRMKLKHIPSYPGQEWDELTGTDHLHPHPHIRKAPAHCHAWGLS